MGKVLNSKESKELFGKAKSGNYALPAVNVIGNNSINACLETAKKVSSPIIIQMSNGGAAFYCGKSLKNDNHQSSVLGAVTAAKYINDVAGVYGVNVIVHTDHAAKNLLPWIDGMLEEGEKFYKKNGRPLFTSHMLDLSEEPISENIEICKRYLEKLTALDMLLEIELGITGGEEDGVDNTGVDSSKLYTQPEEVAYAYEELSKISDNFTIAAAFGNVHGVYKPGNVKLEPKILKNSQTYVKDKFKLAQDNPIDFVFHGGSGSSADEISETLNYGVIKMNIDTDLQWAFWDGVRGYYFDNSDRLQAQIGSLKDPDIPNKKLYDPRVWLRKAEDSFSKRLITSFEELNCLSRS